MLINTECLTLYLVCVYEFNQNLQHAVFFKNGSDTLFEIFTEFLHSNDNSHDHDKQLDILSAVLVCDFCVIVLDMPCQYQQFIGLTSCCI